MIKAISNASYIYEILFTLTVVYILMLALLCPTFVDVTEVDRAALRNLSLCPFTLKVQYVVWGKTF